MTTTNPISSDEALQVLNDNINRLHDTGKLNDKDYAKMFNAMKALSRPAALPEVGGRLLCGFDYGSDDLSCLTLSEKIDGKIFIRVCLYGDDALYVQKALEQAAGLYSNRKALTTDPLAGTPDCLVG